MQRISLSDIITLTGATNVGHLDGGQADKTSRRSARSYGRRLESADAFFHKVKRQ